MKLSPSQNAALHEIDQGKVSRVPRGINQWKTTAPVSTYDLRRLEHTAMFHWRKEDDRMRAILTTAGRQALKESGMANP